MQTNQRKKKLIRQGVFEHQCQMCLLKEWLGEPIPLELHHIDGNKHNNELENLQILCPNCHAFTPNYRGKSLKGRGKKWLCVDCLKPIHRGSIRCRSHSAIERNKHKGVRNYVYKTRINWPEDQVLVDLLRVQSALAVSKILGVSDNAIKHRLQHKDLWPVARTEKVLPVGFDPTTQGL